MGYFIPYSFPLANPICISGQKIVSTFNHHPYKDSIFHYPCEKSNLYPLPVCCYTSRGEKSRGNAAVEAEKPKLQRVKRSVDLNKEQKQAVFRLPSKMTNRCKALMKKIICFPSGNESVSLMLAAWVKNTNPQRADWLSVLKELDGLNHPLYFKVAEHALTEESFETNVRDYTKIMHNYAKKNMLEEAEHTLLAMNNRGFLCDQVTLTALVHMYSKAGDLKLAEDSFEEMKMLGVKLDRRSYGSMIMAYIRAGMFDRGESLLIEMEDQEIYAGREVYKALLRAYSMAGDSRGAQRVFDAIQLAGIIPDVKICGLLINAYAVSGQTREACIAFDNMRRAGLEPSDKCVALVLAAYAKENRLKEAMDFLVKLERDGILIGKEASELLVMWFQKLGVVEEVQLVLQDFGLRMSGPTP